MILDFFYKYRFIIAFIVFAINFFLACCLDLFRNPQEYPSLFYYWFLPSYFMGGFGLCIKNQKEN